MLENFTSSMLVTWLANEARTQVAGYLSSDWVTPKGVMGNLQHSEMLAEAPSNCTLRSSCRRRKQISRGLRITNSAPLSQALG